ncbi:hypothetical protein ABZ714_08795 [Streptomyces sp. NPDC006798]|uniref:hypothetical protein n=1 Tax=Streptomyces sp. NPDC006798 TaxID=3155462 RepID=UPI0033E78F33
MAPTEVAVELADLRREIGDELASGLLTQATEHYTPAPTDTHGMARIKRRAYGVTRRAADWISQATAPT